MNTTGDKQVLSDSLGFLAIQNFSDTSLTIRLTAYQEGAPAVEDKIRIFLDKTPPKMSELQITNMIDGNLHSVLIEFATDDLCRATILVA